MTTIDHDPTRLGGEEHDAAPVTAHDATGHGSHHSGATSMADMARDLRNRFALAALLSIPILLFSPIGREVLGFEAEAPFGLRDDVPSLALSLPVVLWSAWASSTALGGRCVLGRWT